MSTGPKARLEINVSGIMPQGGVGTSPSGGVGQGSAGIPPTPSTVEATSPSASEPIKRRRKKAELPSAESPSLPPVQEHVGTDDTPAEPSIPKARTRTKKGARPRPVKIIPVKAKPVKSSTPPPLPSSPQRKFRRSVRTLRMMAGARKAVRGVASGAGKQAIAGLAGRAGGAVAGNIGAGAASSGASAAVAAGVGSSALMAVGATAGAVAAVGAFVVALKKADSALEKMAHNLQHISPQITMAAAQSEFRRTQMHMQLNERFGDQLGSYTESKGDLANAIEKLKSTFTGNLSEPLERIVKMLTVGVELMTPIADGIGKVVEFILTPNIVIMIDLAVEVLNHIPGVTLPKFDEMLSKWLEKNRGDGNLLEELDALLDPAKVLIENKGLVRNEAAPVGPRSVFAF